MTVKEFSPHMLCNELALSSSSSPLKAIEPVLDDELPILLVLLLLNIVALIAVLELVEEGRSFIFKNFYCSSGQANPTELPCLE